MDGCSRPFLHAVGDRSGIDQHDRASGLLHPAAPDTVADTDTPGHEQSGMGAGMLVRDLTPDDHSFSGQEHGIRSYRGHENAPAAPAPLARA